MQFTPPQAKRDLKVWAYVGSIQTVCKGIQNAEAVCLDEKSELKLERDFRNKVDACAIKVMVKCAQFAAEDDSDTSDENYSSSESSPETSPEAQLAPKDDKKQIEKWKYCGYLSSKLVPFLAPILDEFVLKKNVCVAVDCVMRGREATGLSVMNKKITWFDVQLDLFVNQDKDSDKDAENAICELLIKQETNPEILT